MSEVIKFNLKGLSGIIKRPDSNVIYFTYNNIHKIAILGILGAIIGENGYNYNSLKRELKKEVINELPEFYTNLKDFKIAVVPNIETPVFMKKVQAFNNSVGFASKEDGNNLIITEQWLENPSWDIYILENSSVKYEKLKEYLTLKKCEYIPYIGKNEHFANINNVEIFEAKIEYKPLNINSIFTDIEYTIVDKFEEMFYGFNDNEEITYEYTEILPTAIDPKIGYKDFKKFIYTNKNLKFDENVDNVYNVNDKILYFF